MEPMTMTISLADQDREKLAHVGELLEQLLEKLGGPAVPAADLHPVENPFPYAAPEQPAESAKTAEIATQAPAGKEYTLPELQHMVSDLIKKNANNRQLVKDTLRSFGTEKLSGLDPAKYAEFWSTLEAANG